MTRRPPTAKRKIFYLLFLLAFLFLISPKFIFARKVECYTQFGLCPGEWQIKLEELKKTALLRPLPSAKVRNLLADTNQIHSFKLFRRLPSTLVVSVELRRPLGAVGPVDPQVLGVADENGTVFSLSTGHQLPHLLISQTPQINFQLTPLQLQALKALSVLNSFSPSPLVGNLEFTTLSTKLPDGPLIVVDVKKDPQTWQAPLHLILERSRISPKLPAKIDLRFNNPIISYN